MNSRRLTRTKAWQRARYLFSRWPLADLLNRSRRSCWADLVPWGLGWEATSLRESLREIRDDGAARCRKEASVKGCCYCAKFQSPTFQAEHVPQHFRRGHLVPDEAVR